MTVIAWDGKTLAADKRMTYGSSPITVTKIHRVPQGIVGIHGGASHGMAIVLWLRQGATRSKFPKVDDADHSAGVLLITKSGKAYSLEGHTSPVFKRIEDARVACGSGADFARTAMSLGMDARAAVGIACQFDIYCGNGIDYMEP
jgi:ATP-dependent protease HslVU (ClpYQ) peptidase subunit